MLWQRYNKQTGKRRNVCSIQKQFIIASKDIRKREQRFNNTFETKYYNILKESNNHILLLIRNL